MIRDWFTISLDPFSTRLPDWELGAYLGRIEIGERVEEFVASATLWTADEYRGQWRTAVNRVVTQRAPSALITSVDDPLRSTMLFWWPLYPENDHVHVQNAILFFDQLDRPFNLDRADQFIPPRETHDEDGAPISEWTTSVSALAQFLSRTS